MSWLLRKQSTKEDHHVGIGEGKKKTRNTNEDIANTTTTSSPPSAEKSKFAKQKSRGFLFSRRKSHDKGSIVPNLSPMGTTTTTATTTTSANATLPAHNWTESYQRLSDTTTTPSDGHDKHCTNNNTEKSNNCSRTSAQHQDVSSERPLEHRNSSEEDLAGVTDDGFEEYHLTDSELRVLSEPQSPEDKQQNRLKHISCELLETEETYVDKLKVIFEIAKLTTETLGEQVSGKLFPNITAVYLLHSDNLLPELRQRVDTWHSGSRLGDVMCRLTPFLKLYTEFVKNFHSTTQLIQQWRQKSAAFDKIVKTYPTTSLRLGIDALMIEPIQRVPRYKLLLTDYLKHLPDDSADIPDIKKALEQVSSAAEHFETMMKKDAQIDTLNEIQNSLVGGRNIFNLSRRLVKKCVVFERDNSTGLTQECLLYLFNDILMITVPLSGSLSGSRKQRMRHLVELSKIKIQVGENSAVPFSLNISTRSVTIQFGLRNIEERQELVELLHVQMADSTKRKLIKRGTWSEFRILTKKCSLGESAPQFVPPHTVPVCMCCGEQFASQKKKKHCAACGMVVCGKCSMNKEILAYDPNEPLRICLKCKEEFTKHRKSCAF